MKEEKAISELTPADLGADPVWEFLPESHDRDETWVVPVRRLPVRHLEGRIVAARLRLACGTAVPGTLGNVSVDSPRGTEHFLTVTVFCSDGQSFHLARYHDADRHLHGPAALAEFLGVTVAEGFPITYDISAVARGNPEVLKGSIEAEPRERLSDDDLLDLALA
jgi:hypothetical protein